MARGKSATYRPPTNITSSNNSVSQDSYPSTNQAHSLMHGSVGLSAGWPRCQNIWVEPKVEAKVKKLQMDLDTAPEVLQLRNQDTCGLLLAIMFTIQVKQSVRSFYTTKIGLKSSKRSLTGLFTKIECTADDIHTGMHHIPEILCGSLEELRAFSPSLSLFDVNRSFLLMSRGTGFLFLPVLFQFPPRGL